MSLAKLNLAALLALGLVATAGHPAPPAAKPPAAEPAARRDEELHFSLHKTVTFGGVEDPKVTLKEVLDHLAERYKLTFDVNHKAFDAEKVHDVLKTPVAEGYPLPPMKATAAAVLKKVLARLPVDSGAVYLIRKEAIEITTTKAVRAELGVAKDRPLFPLVWEVFRGTSLQKALNQLADASGYSVALDGRCAEKGKTAVSVRLANVPVDTAARLLADMAGLAVVRLDNVLYLTSVENAKRLKAEQAAKPAAGRGR
jgi:hypothetical protein